MSLELCWTCRNPTNQCYKLKLNSVTPCLRNFRVSSSLFHTSCLGSPHQSFLRSTIRSVSCTKTNEKQQEQPKTTYPAAVRLKACGLSHEKLTLSFTVGTSLFRSADAVKVDGWYTSTSVSHLDKVRDRCGFKLGQVRTGL